MVPGTLFLNVGATIFNILVTSIFNEMEMEL